MWKILDCSRLLLSDPTKEINKKEKKKKRRRLAARRRGALGSSAVTLYSCALRIFVKLAADLRGCAALYLRGKSVGAVREGAGQLGAVNVSSEEGSGSDKVERASSREVVDLGRVPFGLHGLSGRDDLERLLIQVGGLKPKTDAVERDLVGCITSNYSVSKL